MTALNPTVLDPANIKPVMNTWPRIQSMFYPEANDRSTTLGTCLNAGSYDAVVAAKALLIDMIKAQVAQFHCRAAEPSPTMCKYIASHKLDGFADAFAEHLGTRVYTIWRMAPDAHCATNVLKIKAFDAVNLTGKSQLLGLIGDACSKPTDGATFQSQVILEGHVLEQQNQEVQAVDAYPVATFIKPTEYVWDNDVYDAKEAVKAYLKDSHADH